MKSIYLVLSFLMMILFQNCSADPLFSPTNPITTPYCEMTCGCYFAAAARLTDTGPFLADLGRLERQMETERIPTCGMPVSSLSRKLLYLTMGSRAQACSRILITDKYEIEGNKVYFTSAQNFGETSVRYEVVGADPETFSFKTYGGTINSYAIDKNHVYYRDAIMQGVDLATLKISPSGLARDAHTSYYGARPRPADLCSMPNGLIRGGGQIFYQTSRTPIELATYGEFPGSSYYVRDQQNIYCLLTGEPVRLEADLASFVASGVTAHDRDKRFVSCRSASF